LHPEYELSQVIVGLGVSKSGRSGRPSPRPKTKEHLAANEHLPDDAPLPTIEVSEALDINLVGPLEPGFLDLPVETGVRKH